MIKRRYISCLLDMTIKDLTFGINELNQKYEKIVNFTDSLKCISYKN